MTALAPPSVAARPRAISIGQFGRFVPGVLALFAVGYTTTLFAQGVGGRAAGASTKAAVVVLAALLAVKPWRHLRAGVLSFASAISIAALLVCLVTPPGWFGINRAASYGLAAATFVTVAAYVRKIIWTRTVAVVVVVAGGVQFFWAFIPWWGGRSQSVAMTGTFYWHNQFAAFLLAPALIGLALLIEGRAPWRFAGWLVVPFAVAGAVFSASRGALLVLVAGWLVLGALSARDGRSKYVALRRWCAASVLAAAVTFALCGPPFFASERLPWSATQARASAGETAAINSHYRVYMWREAISVFEHHPLDGVGYGALAPAAAKVTPATWPRSPLAHDDYLQSLTDGGLLLGIPFLGSCIAIGVLLLRGARRRVAMRAVNVRTGVIVGAGALLTHSAIDFNWSYPALFTLAAVACALAVAPMLKRPATAAHPDQSMQTAVRGQIVRVALVGALVTAVIVGAVGGRHGGMRLAYQPKVGVMSTGTAK